MVGTGTADDTQRRREGGEGKAADATDNDSEATRRNATFGDRSSTQLASDSHHAMIYPERACVQTMVALDCGSRVHNNSSGSICVEVGRGF